MRALLIFVLAFSVNTIAAPPDSRYCGPPKRDADGTIHRSQSVLDAFQRVNPCPSTKSTTGQCPGWIKDHVHPLASCGCDSVENLQWLPVEMWKAKSLWERKVYSCKA